MEKEQIIPQDIQDDAESIYPVDLYSGFPGTDRNVPHRNIYIKGMMAERAKQDILLQKVIATHANTTAKWGLEYDRIFEEGYKAAQFEYSISDSKDLDKEWDEFENRPRKIYDTKTRLPVSDNKDVERAAYENWKAYSGENEQGWSSYSTGFRDAVAWRDKQSSVSNDFEELYKLHTASNLSVIDKATWKLALNIGAKWAKQQYPVGGWSDEDMMRFAEYAEREERASWAMDTTINGWLEEYKKTHTPVPVVGYSDAVEFLKWVQKSPFVYNSRRDMWEFDIEDRTNQQLYEVFLSTYKHVPDTHNK